jgi:DNA-binding transcriptional LysR family regulator
MPNEALPYSEFLEGAQLTGIDWDDFRVFLAVVEVGSLHRASAALGLTQPTASKRLARLEKALGIRLFDRDRSGSRLTHEGMRVYTDVSAARLSLSRAARNAKNAKTRIEGDCKILIGDGLANYWLPQFLGSFFDLFPNIEIKLFVSTDPIAGKNELFDLQLNYYQPAEVDPVSLRLGTMHFIPFASPAYLRRFGTPKSLPELAGHRLLGHVAYLIDKGSWGLWSREEFTQAMSLLTNQSGPLAAAVKLGVGIALLPTYSALVDPDFVPIDLGQRFRSPIFLSFQREAAKKWPVRTTLDYLRDVVFDKKAMPWFADQYEPVAPEWRARFEAMRSQPFRGQPKCVPAEVAAG